MRIKNVPVKRGRIEIIPMIDVVFFLLVFSMLTSLALAAIDTPKVNVPEAGHAESGAPTRVFLTLTEDRKLFVNQKQIEPDQLVGEVKAQVDRNPELFVIINVDRSRSWGEFRALVAAAYKADPKHLAIMTKSRSAKPRS